MKFSDLRYPCQKEAREGDVRVLDDSAAPITCPGRPLQWGVAEGKDGSATALSHPLQLWQRLIHYGPTGFS